jgi:phage gp16-like protein
MANAKLIKLIHTAKTKLGLDDEDYRAMLNSVAEGKTSSKELTDHQALNLIAAFEKIGFESTNQNHKNYKDLKSRAPKYASDAQLRMIEAMWMSSPAVRVKTKDALNAFVKRIAFVDRLEWLYKSKVHKVVKAIQELK